MKVNDIRNKVDAEFAALNEAIQTASTTKNLSRSHE
jgi:hypothetical protein